MSSPAGFWGFAVIIIRAQTFRCDIDDIAISDLLGASTGNVLLALLVGSVHTNAVRVTFVQFHQPQ